MKRPRGRRHQHRQRLANHLRHRIPEQTFRGRVDHEHLALFVYGNDGITDGLGQRAVAFFTLAYGRVGPFALMERSLQRGGIAFPLKRRLREAPGAPAQEADQQGRSKTRKCPNHNLGNVMAAIAKRLARRGEREGYVYRKQKRAGRAGNQPAGKS